jgi:hypothetical protein
MTAARLITNTTAYPVYATKTAFLADLLNEIEKKGCQKDNLLQLVYRLSNTDTANWAGTATVRHDD